MRKAIVIMTLALVCFLGDTTTAPAAQNDLTLAACSDTTGDETMQLLCTAYLAGWTDAYAMVQSVPAAGKVVCLPADGRSGGLWTAIVRDWLQRHPGEAVSARMATLEALAEHFPCKPKAGK